MQISESELAVLGEARRKAAALLAEIVSKNQELERNPPKLSDDKLAEGREAMQRATEAAQRLLENIDRALAEAGTDPQ
jgi:hypothetical protein